MCLPREKPVKRYHIVTGMALLFWSAISKQSSISFVCACKYCKMMIDLNILTKSGATFSLHPSVQTNLSL